MRKKTGVKSSVELMEENYMASDAVSINKFHPLTIPRGAIDNFGYIRSKYSISKLNNFINKEVNEIPTFSTLPIEDSDVKVDFFKNKL
jgi:hypothetical protein